MKRTSSLLCGSWAFLAMAFLVAPAWAQTTTGVIDGVVRDPDGSPLPGVRVVVNSPALIQRDLTVYANENGYYRAPTLPPGTYTVVYQLEGFQSIERSELIVSAGQTTTVNVELSLAAVEEQITVTGESPTIDHRSAKLGFNYTETLVKNIPTGRDFHRLVETIPGVESATNFGTNQPGANEQQNVLGAGPRANFYMFDGVNATDPTVQSNQANLFSYDIIQEVQVIRGAKPAEVGFTQGGFFQVVTKSGGNDFSGEGSFYYQDDALQADNIDERLRRAGVTTSNRLIEAFDASISVGGKFIQDKLWWYGSARRQEQTLQLLGFPEDLEDTVTALFWKNTWQVSPRHRITGIVNHWDETVNFFFFGFPPSLARDPEASMLRKPHGDAFNVRWNGVLTDNVIADLAFGVSDLSLDQLFQEGVGVAVRDLVTGDRFRNPGNGSRDHDSDNWDANGSLSWFVADAGGRHDLKFGFEYTHSPFSWGFDEFRDHRLSLVNGAPFLVTILNTPVDAAWTQNYTSLYAQDGWTIADRLTLNLGVRFDRIDSFAPDQESGGGEFADTPLADRFPELKRTTIPETDLLTWNSVAPRLAGTYSVDRDGRTVLKASFSRYYHYLQAQQLITANPNFPFFLVFFWNDLNADREFQAGEEGTLLAKFGGALNSVDPQIEHPFSDELVVGLSHELFTDFSLNASFIYRKDERLTNTVDAGIPFDTYQPVEIVDPGEDGVVGTADDGTLTVFAQDPATFGQSRIVLTNPAGNDRTYKGFELIANKRLSNNWQFVGSLVISEMEVIQPTPDTGASGLFQNPNSLINARGEDPLNQTVQFKLQGTYLAPYGIVLSGFYRFGSGLPFTRQLVVLGLPQGPFTVLAEPRGSRETDNINLVDLRVEKAFEISDGVRLGLLLDVFNLLNASTVIQEGSRTGVDLGVPRAVRNPLIARLGVRLSW